MTEVKNKSIFGEYSKDEDRVTTALLQILHYGGHELVDYVFPECFLPSNAINVNSQVVNVSSRPDGEISCDCHYHIFIESKIVTNAMKNQHEKTQLANHKLLVSPGSSKWLVYITPDENCPASLENLPDVIWVNWSTIIERLDGFPNNDNLLQFLINQFKLLVEHVVYEKQGYHISNRGLMFSEEERDAANKRVIIVGGAWGENVALKYGFYACQEGRFFKPAKYLAFCFRNRIQYLFEIVGNPQDSVNLKKITDIDPEYFVSEDPNYDESPRKYFNLKKIHEFIPVIQNDSRDKNNKPCAFVQRQTYTEYDVIMKAKKTSEL